MGRSNALYMTCCITTIATIYCTALLWHNALGLYAFALCVNAVDSCKRYAFGTYDPPSHTITHLVPFQSALIKTLNFFSICKTRLVGRGPILDANVGLGTTAMSGLFLLQKICSPIRLQSSSVKAWLINERVSN